MVDAGRNELYLHFVRILAIVNDTTAKQVDRLQYTLVIVAVVAENIGLNEGAVDSADNEVHVKVLGIEHLVKVGATHGVAVPSGEPFVSRQQLVESVIDHGASAP